MYIRKLSNGLTRIHLHDWDDYQLTDHKGVNCDLSDEQIKRIIQFNARRHESP
jgi:hypothetical protein